MQRFWRAETGFFLGLWLVLAVAGRSSLFQDPGTFWHTVVGRRILASRDVPYADWLSFTFADQPWVATQWLAEVVMAVTHARLGWDGFLLLTATLLAGVFTLVAHRLMKAGLAPLPTAMVVAVAAAASSHHFHARPHLATLLCLTVLMAQLIDVEANRRSVRSLWWCLPLFVLWTNLHGGALAGWGMLLIAAGGWLAWRVVRWESPLIDRRAILHLAAIVSACAAALVASPYGLDTPRTWLRVMSLDLPDLIEEHAPLDLSQPEGLATLLIAVSYLGLLVSAWPRKPRVVWLLPLLWAYLAVGRVRHAPLFALTAAIAAADILPYSRLAVWLKGRGWWRGEEFSETRSTASVSVPGFSSIVGPCCLPLALIVLAVALQLAGIHAPLIGRGWARLDPQLWPVELAGELDAVADDPAPPLSQQRIFNSLDLGGFVAFHAPRSQTFIDDRCELFGGDFLRRYAAAETSQPEQFDRWADQYNLHRALVRTGSPFDAHLAQSPQWAIVRRTTAAALYQRHGEAEKLSAEKRSAKKLMAECFSADSFSAKSPSTD